MIEILNMSKLIILSAAVVFVHSTHFITKVNETVHTNVILENEEAWNPEMYAKKVILRNFRGGFGSKTFILLKNLEELYIAQSTIEFIHPEAFKETPMLKILQFSYNTKLPFLTNEVLKNCRNLKKIVIGHNNIVEGISDILFSGLKNLTHIEVTRETKFPRRLTSELFKNSKSLESIKIHFSNITKIESETFEGLDHLNFLSLVENELVEIGPNAFRGRELSNLHLAWNKLQIFSGSELDSGNIGKLKHLDLSFNPLKQINLEKIRKIAPSLKSLGVAKTDLTCENKKEVLKHSGLEFHVHMNQQEIQKCEV